MHMLSIINISLVKYQMKLNMLFLLSTNGFNLFLTVALWIRRNIFVEVAGGCDSSTEPKLITVVEGDTVSVQCKASIVGFEQPTFVKALLDSWMPVTVLQSRYNIF